MPRALPGDRARPGGREPACRPRRCAGAGVRRGRRVLDLRGGDSVLRLVERPADARPAASEDAPALAAAAARPPWRRCRRRADRRGSSRASSTGGGRPRRAARAAACNGHAELCGRRLNEVALAATHNSMSAPLPGWFSAACTTGRSRGSSRGGIRGLLIDTHYADLLPNGAAADRPQRPDRSVRPRDDGVSPQDVAAALRIRERARRAGRGASGACTSATRSARLAPRRSSPVLADVREFLVANPGEVLVIVNQDYDLARGLRRRGPRRGPRAVRLPRAGRRRLADAAGR